MGSYQTVFTFSPSYYQTVVNTFLRVSDSQTDRIFLKRKFSKCENVACTHEADNFGINYFWVYMIGHLWLYGRKWSSSPSPKKETRCPQYRSSPKNLKFSQPLATRYEKKYSFTKKIFVGSREYIPWKQKWKIVEITIGIFFFFLDSYSLFFTLLKIMIWPASPLYKHFPNGSAPPPPHYHLGGANYDSLKGQNLLSLMLFLCRCS